MKSINKHVEVPNLVRKGEQSYGKNLGKVSQGNDS